MTYDSPVLSAFVVSFALLIGCVDGGTGDGNGADSPSETTGSGSESESDSGDGDGDGDPSGDGDGDPSGDGDPGDGDPGDGDPSGDGDGDGDPSGDGDADPTTGDGDGDGDTGGDQCTALACGSCYVCARNDDPNACAAEKAACEGDPGCVEIADYMYWCGAPVDPEFVGCLEDGAYGMPGEDLYMDLVDCLSCDVCDCADYWEC
jgi:hypothetical protein